MPYPANPKSAFLEGCRAKRKPLFKIIILALVIGLFGAALVGLVGFAIGSLIGGFVGADLPRRPPAPVTLLQQPATAWPACDVNRRRTKSFAGSCWASPGASGWTGSRI